MERLRARHSKEASVAFLEELGQFRPLAVGTLVETPAPERARVTFEALSSPDGVQKNFLRGRYFSSVNWI